METLKFMEKNGYRHHIAITRGCYASAVREALNDYLDYKIELI